MEGSLTPSAKKDNTNFIRIHHTANDKQNTGQSWELSSFMNDNTIIFTHVKYWKSWGKESAVGPSFTFLLLLNTKSTIQNIRRIQTFVLLIFILQNLLDREGIFLRRLIAVKRVNDALGYTVPTLEKLYYYTHLFSPFFTDKLRKTWRGGRRTCNCAR